MLNQNRKKTKTNQKMRKTRRRRRILSFQQWSRKK